MTTNPRAVLVAYEGETAMTIGAIPINRAGQAPKAFAALRAVLDLHASAPGYAWCMHCSGGSYTERYPCPTVRAITTALEAS